MHSHSDQERDNLSAMERCLAQWKPASEGLDADAMLFHAGLAAGGRSKGRVFWPTVSFFLALVSLGLGTWGYTLRAEHQTLVQILHEQKPTMNEIPHHSVPVVDIRYVPSPNDYFQLRQQAERNAGNWPTSLQPSGSQNPQPPTNLDILQARQFDRL